MVRFLSRYVDVLIALIVVLGAMFILINAGRGATPVMPQYTIDGADPSQGLADMASYGCGSCHTIPNLSGANGKVGPSLEHFGSHSYIAGQFPNIPDNLVAWIQNPQQMIPGNAMPNLNVSDQAARDIADYLYTQH